MSISLCNTCLLDKNYCPIEVSEPIKKCVEYKSKLNPFRNNESDGTAAAQKHYQVAEKQPIELMQEYLPQEQFIGLMRGQVLKYSLRFGHKDDIVKEADKIYQYAKWLRQAVRGEKINPRREVELADERKWQELG